MLEVFKRKENRTTIYSSRELNVLLLKKCRDPKNVSSIIVRYKKSFDSIVEYVDDESAAYINVPTKKLQVNGTISETIRGFTNLSRFDKEGIDLFNISESIKMDDSMLRYNSETSVEKKITESKDFPPFVPDFGYVKGKKISSNTKENEFTMRISFDGSGVQLKLRSILHPDKSSKTCIHIPSQIVMDKVMGKDVSYLVSNIKNMCILKINDGKTGKEILNLTIIKISPSEIIKIVNTNPQIGFTRYLVDNSLRLIEI